MMIWYINATRTSSYPQCHIIFWLQTINFHEAEIFLTMIQIELVFALALCTVLVRSVPLSMNSPMGVGHNQFVVDDCDGKLAWAKYISMDAVTRLKPYLIFKTRSTVSVWIGSVMIRTYMSLSTNAPTQVPKSSRATFLQKSTVKPPRW